MSDIIRWTRCHCNYSFLTLTLSKFCFQPQIFKTDFQFLRTTNLLTSSSSPADTSPSRDDRGRTETSKKTEWKNGRIKTRAGNPNHTNWSTSSNHLIGWQTSFLRGLMNLLRGLTSLLRGLVSLLRGTNTLQPNSTGGGANRCYHTIVCFLLLVLPCDLYIIAERNDWSDYLSSWALWHKPVKPVGLVTSQ